ncbi:MAG: hypothetical protein V1902_03780 [Candidatus Falkowbacteria bacterium]
MRKTALFAVVLALAAACTLENPINWDGLVFTAPDSEDGWVPDVESDDSGLDVDQQEDSAPIDVTDIPDVLLDVKDNKDAKDAEVVNPCPEGEYPDPQLMKCLKYPCCEVGGAWMLQMLAIDEPLVYSYSVEFAQDKAFVEMFVLGAAAGSKELPETVSGTLEVDVLHLDGGDPGVTGFLMMDAKKVEKQLFESSKIVGSYKLIINGEPTHSGQWTLTSN